jgi:hypothetical protein
MPCLEKAKRDPLPADTAIDEEADHRPHGCVVDTREGLVPLQGRVRFSRCKRAPADGVAIHVREHADRRALADELVKCSHTALRRRPVVVRARHAPAHAGTVAELPMLLREAGQVR